jgi:hypothetical protein
MWPRETFSYIAIGLSTEPIGCARTLYDIYSLLLVLYFYSFILFIFYQGSTENHFREWTPWLNIVIIIIIIIIITPASVQALYKVMHN